MRIPMRMWDRQEKRMIHFEQDGWHLSYSAGGVAVYHNSILQPMYQSASPRFVIMRGLANAAMVDGEVTGMTARRDIAGTPHIRGGCGADGRSRVGGFSGVGR